MGTECRPSFFPTSLQRGSDWSAACHASIEEVLDALVLVLPMRDPQYAAAGTHPIHMSVHIGRLSVGED